jgi:hypothetical protein
MRTLAIAYGFFVAACITGFFSSHCYGQSTKENSRMQGLTKFVGVWRGQFEGLPEASIVVSDEGGQFTGAILFYFHSRPDVNSPWTSKPGLPEPMFDMKLDGSTLKFMVSHRRAHPPGSLDDPPAHFHMTVTGPDKADLLNEAEGPPLAMTRSAY